MAFRGQDQFRTDPTGVLARGAPSGGGGGGFPIGGIRPIQIPPSVQPGGSPRPGPSAPGGIGVTIGSGGGARPGDMGNITRGTGKIYKHAKGGKVKKMAKGGSVSSASKRADGCATKGKTKGRFV